MKGSAKKKQKATKHPVEVPALVNPSECFIFDHDTKELQSFDPSNPPASWIDVRQYAATGRQEVMVARVNDTLKRLRPPPPVEVRLSGPDRGYGLFATQEIAQGAVVAEYGGVICRRTDLAGPYIIEADGQSHDAERFFHPRDVARFINEPPYALMVWTNVDFTRGHTENRLFAVAKRTIQKGEEIYWDYGKDYGRTYDAQTILNSNDVDKIRNMRNILENLVKTPGLDVVRRRAAEGVIKDANERLAMLKTRPPAATTRLCLFCGRLADPTIQKYGGFFCTRECMETYAWIFRMP